MTAGTLKVAACLVLLFGSGAVCGVAVTVRRFADPDVRARAEERWIEKRRDEDAQRLQLTPEQEARVEASYRQLLTDVRAVREKAATDLVNAAKRQGEALWTHLTPEQREQFRRISEERRARWEAKRTP